MTLCIIGAGTAGLCATRHAVAHNLTPTVFEISSEVGGTWVLNKEKGTSNGVDVHSSMYENLRTNFPKEVMGFPDFEIGENELSYITSQEVLEFLNRYADHFDLRKYIKFNSYVIRVVQKRNKWQVIVKDLLTNKPQIHYFDYVIIANGHYNAPNYAEIPKANLFKGEYLHSHDYRHSEIFEGKSVLIIGGGPSGFDLANHISTSAKRVVLSHHVKDIPSSIFLPVVTKPDVKEFDEWGAHFVDGSYEQFDTIFYCTGYKLTFPFVSLDCGLYVENNHVQLLYKQCFNLRKPSMAIIGLPSHVCISQMIDLQCRFVFSYFCGKNQLPTEKEMRDDVYQYMELQRERGFTERQFHSLGKYQMDYFTDLSNTAQVENVKPVMVKLVFESIRCFRERFFDFRKIVFKIVDDENFITVN